MEANIMKIDFATLAFGYKVKTGGNTPNWATSLGQGRDYKINDNPQFDELLKGLIYSSVPLAKVTTKIGKGGKVVSGDSEESPIVVASIFQKVYVNENLINGGKYLLLITRDTSKSHEGRLRVKYGPSNTYNSDEGKYSNDMFWSQAKGQLKLADESCFFVYDINVKNQNELVLSTIVVKEDCEVEYADSNALHDAWDALIKEDERTKESSSSEQLAPYDVNVNEVESSNNHLYACLEVRRNPRTHKIHPLNCIVYGAPGTGKTFSMIEYALAIIENKKLDDFLRDNKDRIVNIGRFKELVRDGQVVFTTFHQNYGYEEFIQGLRPDPENNAFSFRIIDGVFKIIADKALNDKEDKNYVIIIDEINRANISKVFGELITLIEDDKRWGEINEMSATLQSGDVFAVPNNLYIVGTMNSADKSISLIDAALRRRFDFFELKPNSMLVTNPVLKLIFEAINRKLVEELDSTDLLIGHSYFMNKNEKELCDILNSNIIPLLYEYFYDNRKKVANLIDFAINEAGAQIEIDDDKIGRLRVKDL
jgi:hypothetical protein